MSIGISELGLLFIGASWFIQVFDTSPKNTKLNRQFVLLYGLGVALLLVDGVFQGSKITNLLHLLAFAGSAVVFLRMKK
jgi:hypothetical protein